MQRFSRLCLFAALAAGAFAQDPIRFLPEKKLFQLDAGPVSYVFGVNEQGNLQHVYWGERLYRDADLAQPRSNQSWASFDLSPTTTPEEYPAWGGARYAETCLKVTFADNNRDLVLKYVSHEIKGGTLEVRTKDIAYDIFAVLVYKIFPDGIICKSSRIENKTTQSVTVESAQSGVWHMPRGDGYRLNYLTGRWAGETQLITEDIHPGAKILESRRGSTSAAFNPWFAVQERGASEDQGRVWFGALGWSGSWKFSVEQTPHQSVRVTGGYNPFDFAYPLKPGESLETPPFYGGFSDKGLGEASRRFHHFQRASILPRDRVRPLLYNSWEATTFDVNEEGQKRLADKAARIGVELFVMDDGWFGARDHDRAGLGDWFVNSKKFPNGLKGLIDYVKSRGMAFGLWFEPEMINPDSDLYRAHPDWVMSFPNRPRTEGRNQMVLNVARDDVKEYLFARLDKLLSENDIRFIKWDSNRHWSEPGWAAASPADQKKIWVRYVQNLYEIIDRLRKNHPEVEFESCSGGGARIDLGILSRVEQVWTSDNTEAFDRLRIQEGFTYAYTPKAMMAWVTDVPNMNGRSTPLEFRFLVSMSGSVGIGANLDHWKESDFALATSMVAWYKSVRKTVQEGRLYRLLSPREGTTTAVQYNSEDGKQAVLFAYLQAQQYGRPYPQVYLKGLDERATYRVKCVNAKLDGKPEILSGATLMRRGLTLNLVGDFDATSVALERID